MRRRDLERRLGELGWTKGERSGRHRIWRHPRRPRDPMYVPEDDLIDNATAADILEDAEG